MLEPLNLDVVFTALEIDLVLKGSDEFYNEFWRHQALAQTVDDQSLESGAANSLAIGVGTAAASGGAGEIIAPDGSVMAATFLAAHKPAQKVAGAPAIPKAGGPRIGNAIACSNGTLTSKRVDPHRVRCSGSLYRDQIVPGLSYRAAHGHLLSPYFATWVGGLDFRHCDAIFKIAA